MNFKPLKASFLLLLGLVISISGCKKDKEVEPEPTNEVFQFTPSTATQEDVQAALIEMVNGDTLEFAAGTYDFIGTLSIADKDSIVVRGAGMSSTILDFTNQTQGAQGFYVLNSNWFLMQDFTIKDAVGDGVKIKDSQGVSVLNIGVEYSGTPSQDNGAYGIYPVTCKHLYINGCYVRGASDAGIYVGQSEDIIVSQNTVTENVAGMEIENCFRADVFENNATRNTGGIMAFDLENLPVIPNGHTCRIYNNTIVNNSHPSFAPPGNTVGAIPVGTGIMVLSYDRVEIFGNTITNNDVMGIGVISMTTLRAIEGDFSPYPADYDPYNYSVYIHDNDITHSGTFPPAADRNDSSNLLVGTFTQNSIFPDIIYDGYAAPIYGENNDLTEGLCISNNGGAIFANVNADAPGPDPNVPFPNFDPEVAPHVCTQDALSAVTVNAPGL